MSTGHPQVSGNSTFLSEPGPSSRGVQLSQNKDAIGRFSESVARSFGTARFLLAQSAVFLLWVGLNIFVAAPYRWDPYPFKFLNLAFSIQAAYAAPFILLAASRQAGRSRKNVELDRERASRTQEDLMYMTHEVALVRLQVDSSLTVEEFDDRLKQFEVQVQNLASRRSESV